MKKIYVLALSLMLIAGACSDPDVMPSSSDKLSPSGLAGLGSATLGNEMSTLAMLVPEELYIADLNQLWAVDNTSGARSAVNWDQAYPSAMASTGGFIFEILNKGLYKIDPTTGSYVDLTPSANWTGSLAMAAGSGYLYIIQNNAMWRVNATTGSYAVFNTGTWNSTQAMAVLGNALYVVQNNALWKVNTSTGAYAVFNTGTWTNTAAMAATGNYVYIIQNTSLWRVDASTGAYAVYGTDTWVNAAAMASYGGNIYVVQNYALWRVNTASPTAATTVGSFSWTDTRAMTGLNAQ